MPLIDIKKLANVRRRKTLRPIVPTGAQADRLYRVYVQPVVIWETVIRERLLPDYARTLSGMVTDSVADLDVDIAAGEAQSVTATFSWASLFRSIISDISEWHFSRFIANLKYATGVDLSSVLRSSDKAETLEAILRRNVSLVRSISDQTRDKIADIIYRGLTNRTPVAEVAKELRAATGFSRDRARRVASDQLVKLSAALDEDRMREVGVDSFEWMHSGKLHYRPWHRARDGKTFRWNDPEIANDKPGQAPFCGCKARGVIE